MTYISDKIEHQGIPYLEFRTEPEIPQQIHLDFVPTYPYDDYAYSEPKFTFCQQVVFARRWEHCQKHQLNFESECQIYQVAALELIEISLTGKNLYEAPHWRYGIRGIQTKELRWVSEDSLISLHEIESEDEF